jgi:Lecithin:cholesterol acyltransferase
MPKANYAVVFVHGLAKKPSPKQLEEIWLWSLERDNPMPSAFPPPNVGVQLATQGVPSLFNYYADVFYGTDYDTDIKAMMESRSDLEGIADGVPVAELPLVFSPAPQTVEEANFLLGFEAKMGAKLALDSALRSGNKEAAIEGKLEIASWLPLVAKQAIIKKAAMEAYYYLFNKEYTRPDGEKFMVRKELRARLLAKLNEALAAAEKVVIVSHSMGTMISYDLLRNVPECPTVDTFITLGSPLGVTEVQEQLIAPDVDKIDFPAPKVGRWINIYDSMDPIAADAVLADDYAVVDGKKIEDIEESNWGSWRHTITHYLAGVKLRATLNKACGLDS